MIVSIHQPAYLPWLGYLDRIAASDIFVFLDTVQFEKNSFTNRNRIKTSQGVQWLTVPVVQSDHLSKPLIELEIEQSRPWQRKHIKSIEQNYRRAVSFDSRFEKLSNTLSSAHDRLAELCFEQLQFWLAELDVGTLVVRASDLSASGKKSQLVLDICKRIGATTYLSGQFGRDYLAETDFKASGIGLVFHEYQHPTYNQLHGAFVPNLSVVDYWLNGGDDQAFRSTEIRR